MFFRNHAISSKVKFDFLFSKKSIQENGVMYYLYQQIYIPCLNNGRLSF